LGRGYKLTRQCGLLDYRKSSGLEDISGLEEISGLEGISELKEFLD
jgi:hypothetical protein